MGRNGTLLRTVLFTTPAVLMGLIAGVLCAPLLHPDSTEPGHRVVAPVELEDQRTEQSEHGEPPSTRYHDHDDELQQQSVSDLEALRRQHERELEGLRAEIQRLKSDRVVAEQPVEDPVVSPRSRADAASELTEALGRVPSDEELEQYLKRQAEIHARILQEFAERVRDTEAAEAALIEGDLMGVLRNMTEVGPDTRNAVNDAERFGAFFERKTHGPYINGSELGTDPPEDGATINFDHGVHVWKVARLGGRGSFPKDLLIVGAGRDRTLLQIDEFGARSEIRSLTFRDLTLDCDNNYMTDLRTQHPVTIRFERCRIVRFDMGAGGSVMLAARNAAFYASDTLIECGYGRSPGTGCLFRCGKLLARLERCTISRPGYGLGLSGSDDQTYVAFVKCKFVGVRDLYDTPDSEHPLNNVAEFNSCSFSGNPGADEPKLQLSGINPGWPND